VNDMVQCYLEGYRLNPCRKSISFANGRLAHVVRLLGFTLLPDLTKETIRRHIRTRLQESASGRTINMELGELSRAIGKLWSVL
jgi:hypothetical protein